MSYFYSNMKSKSSIGNTQIYALPSCGIWGYRKNVIPPLDNLTDDQHRGYEYKFALVGGAQIYNI